MAKAKTRHEKNLPLRHALATLAYRAAKALRNAPAGFLDFRPGESSRSAGEILAHLAELMDWALTQASGKERWHSLKPASWEADSKRFFASLTKLDKYLASGAELRAPAGKIFQGAIADSLTHVGQIAMLRRLAGSPVRGENYSVAKIAAGQTGPDQPAPVQEVD
jgi:hypothetical protein